ncbi:MAG: sugar kinase [Saprospiraceae bacterium]|nr:sugar kinase [Saprospiraceae bacterium]
MIKNKIITFGEIMLRLSPPGHQRFAQATSLEVVYGGGESNVAISLAQFGEEVQFVTRLPDNDLGDAVLAELRRWGVGTSCMLRGGDRLGVYFYEKGAGHRNGKVIYDRADSSMATIQPGMVDWDAVFASATWFHWTGITPAISQGAAAACAEAIEAANHHGLTVSFDLSYRKNLWKYGKLPSEVLPPMVAGCDLVLCSMEDAAAHFGILPKAKEDNEMAAIESVSTQLMERFPKAKKIVMTRRSGSDSASQNLGAVLFDGKKLHESSSYQITQIVDRVGSGDALMAGLLYGLLRNMDDQAALNFGVAAAVLKHSIPGDLNLVTVAEVEALVNGAGGGRVSR